MKKTQPSLQEYVAILRSRWLLILLATALFMGLALVWSVLQTPLYASEVPILLNQQQSAEIFDPTASDSSRTGRFVAMANEVQFAKSQIVEEEVWEKFQDGYTAEVDATGDGDRNDVLTIRTVADDPDEAALVAQTYAQTFIDLRRDQEILEYLDTASVIQERFDDLERQLDELPESATFDRRSLEAEASTLRTALNNLMITADLGGGGGARILHDAEVPALPFEPNVRGNAILGATFGLMFGLGLALLLETLDSSVKSKDQLEELTGVANLSAVPAVRDWGHQDSTRIVTMESMTSPASEAYRTLRAGLSFAAIGSEMQIIQVTSARPGEGKSTTTANLAVAFARAGSRVALIDCDLRKPRQHAFFDREPIPGLTSVMVGDVLLEEACRLVPGCGDNLLLLPSGPLPPGPSELLGSKRFEEVIGMLRMVADYIIIDTPPVLAVADALVVARVADATIVVANAQRSDRQGILAAFESLRKVEAPIVGTVLNQVKRGNLDSSSYGYGYGYGHGDSQAPAKRYASRFRKGDKAERPVPARIDNGIEPEDGAAKANNGADVSNIDFGKVSGVSPRLTRKSGSGDSGSPSGTKVIETPKANAAKVNGNSGSTSSLRNGAGGAKGKSQQTKDNDPPSK